MPEIKSTGSAAAAQMPAVKKPSVPAVVEIVFDVFYLCFVLCAGVWLLLRQQSTAALLYGIMALCLGGGDAFHLVPRICAQATGTMAQRYRALGFGKLVTSVTMTVFYVLLYHVWCAVYAQPVQGVLTAIVYVLALVRIVLCLLPQNAWLTKTPPLRWGIYRNAPFVLLGALVLVLFAVTAASGDGFSLMWLAIAVSFGCYLPVTLLAQSRPKVGMLMLPKTCAYLWMVCMGFSLL